MNDKKTYQSGENMIEWLKDCLEIGEVNEEDIVYSLDKIKQAFEIEAINERSWIVLNWDQNKFILDFAVLTFYSSNTNDTNVKVSCLFHGSGPTGFLRECRHTWWGEEGYVFYPDGPVIIKAFKILSKYFNDLE